MCLLGLAGLGWLGSVLGMGVDFRYRFGDGRGVWVVFWGRWPPLYCADSIKCP